ncbi:hypothetical protein [Kitasatospora sp. NPDC093806]|uniref:hypothetical protein n=1 Tax=Kitasatospora sp. NPDC093806 TaxID=3155075 RepID=UPI003442CFA5
MRRIVTSFATALLAGAAALSTAPAAGAAGLVETPAVQAASPDQNCTVKPDGLVYRGTCSGLDPRQTWLLSATCANYDWNNPGVPIITPGYSSDWVTGNTSTTASCGGAMFVWYIGVVFGPRPA